MHRSNELHAELPAPNFSVSLKKAHTSNSGPTLPVPNFNASDKRSSGNNNIPPTPIKNTKVRTVFTSKEVKPQTTITLTKETTSEIQAERPVWFDYQALIKKIILSNEGDTKHYDGLDILKALMQMPFNEYNTAVIKVSDFITFAKKEVVEVTNLDELRGKAIQVMYGESEIMVIQIIGKEDSLIWWRKDVSHQMELQILTSNRNPFCPSNQEFSFDVIGKIKLSHHSQDAQFSPIPALTNRVAATDSLQMNEKKQVEAAHYVPVTPYKKRKGEAKEQTSHKKIKLLCYDKNTEVNTSENIKATSLQILSIASYENASRSLSTNIKATAEEKGIEWGNQQNVFFKNPHKVSTERSIEMDTKERQKESDKMSLICKEDSLSNTDFPTNSNQKQFI